MIVSYPLVRVKGGGDYYDGALDFNGTATVLGMAPSSSVYTLTQNLSCESVIIRSGVRVRSQGFVIMARTLVIEAGGFLSFNGNDGNGVTGGASVLAASAGHIACACGAGGNGATRTSIGSAAGSAGAGSGGNSVGGVGGNGGAGGAGAGGAGNASAALSASQLRYWRSPLAANGYWRVPPTGNTVATVLVQGGGGGGGGGADWATGPGTMTGGGGGGAAGIVAFSVGLLDNAGTIEAVGGNGAAASLGTATGSAGGGGGGSGGAIHGNCIKLARLGTMRVGGGLGGEGAGAGQPGVPGTLGTFNLFVNGEAY